MRKPGRPWTQSEIDILEREYATESNKELCELLNRSASSVSVKIWELGLRERTIRNLQPTQLSPTEAAYIAGFLDGEGSFRFMIIWRNGKPIRATPVIEGTNSDKSVVEWICQIGRTSGRWATQARYKAIENRYLEPHPIYHFSITGNQRVKGLLLAILPYLHVKKNAALNMLKFIEQHRYKNWSKADWALIVKSRQITNSRNARNRTYRQNLELWFEQTYGPL